MTIAVAFEKTLIFPNTTVHDYSAGAAVLSNGAIVVGCADSAGFEDHQQFFRSMDNGKTWTQGGRLPSYQPQRGMRMLHFPGNKLFYPAVANYSDLKIYGSEDGGLNWILVDTFTGKPDFPDDVNRPFSARSHKLSEGEFAGHFTEETGTVDGDFVVSADAGESWTLGEQLTAGGRLGGLLAYIAAGNNKLWCASENNETFFSDDNGENWTPTTPLPDPGTSTGFAAVCAAALTEDIWIAGGIGNSLHGFGELYLWRTDDGGTTWTVIPPSDVAGYPTSGNNPWIAEAHSFTKEFCVLGFQTRGNMGNSPIRFSQDGGLTYPIQGTGFDYANLQALAGGAIVEAMDGSIIVTIDVTEFGRNNVEVWRGTVEC